MISIVTHTNKHFTQPGQIGRGAFWSSSLQPLTRANMRIQVRCLPINNKHSESYASDLDMT